MVIVVFLALLLTGAEDPIPAAMKEAGFPWYDAAQDSAIPLWPSQEPKPSEPSKISAIPSVPSGPSGNTASLLVGVMMAIGIGVALAAILWAALVFGPPGKKRVLPTPVAGVTRVADLPADLPTDLDDPWSQVAKLRDAGQLTDAVIALYVHLLIILNDRGSIRMAPGKTGRQLVRSISDRVVRGQVEPTLRLFEAAFYGHHEPTRAGFDLAFDAARPLHGATPARDAA